MLLTHLQTAVITVLLRDPFALLRESGRCSHEAEETATDRVNLQEGTQKARLLILPKVRVSVIEVRKAKESNGKKFSEFARKKETRRRIHGPGNQR